MGISEDKNIVRRIINNDNRAINEFVNNNKSFVYTTALRYTNDHFEADDIAQEVFIKALKSLKKFKFKSSLKTWLYIITKNMSLSLINKNKKYNFINSDNINENELSSGLIDKNPQEKLEDEEFYNKFNSALSNLPEKQRETFALRYFEDMKYEEISEITGTSVGGLKANYFQAVKKLSNLMNGDI